TSTSTSTSTTTSIGRHGAGGERAAGSANEPGEHGEEAVREARDAGGVLAACVAQQRCDFESRGALDGFASGDGEGARLISSRDAACGLGDVEANAFRGA